MSFGVSISDVALITKTTYNLVKNTRRACGEHAEITREVGSLHVVLQRLERDVADPTSLLNRPSNTSREDVEQILAGCQKQLGFLEKIIQKYSLLGEEKRAVTKLWAKVKFGNGETVEIKDMRSKITFYTGALTLYLNLVATASMGRVEKQMEDAGKDLRDVKRAVHAITAKVVMGSHGEGSVLTNYTEDNKTVWKEFRRYLVKEGFRSAFLETNRDIIQAYFHELGARGVMDTVTDHVSHIGSDVCVDANNVGSNESLDTDTVNCQGERIGEQTIDVRISHSQQTRAMNQQATEESSGQEQTTSLEGKVNIIRGSGDTVNHLMSSGEYNSCFIEGEYDSDDHKLHIRDTLLGLSKFFEDIDRPPPIVLSTIGDLAEGRRMAQTLIDELVSSSGWRMCVLADGAPRYFRDFVLLLNLLSVLGATYERLEAVSHVSTVRLDAADIPEYLKVAMSRALDDYVCFVGKCTFSGDCFIDVRDHLVHDHPSIQLSPPAELAIDKSYRYSKLVFEDLVSPDVFRTALLVAYIDHCKRGSDGLQSKRTHQRHAQCLAELVHFVRAGYWMWSWCVAVLKLEQDQDKRAGPIALQMSIRNDSASLVNATFLRAATTVEDWVGFALGLYDIPPPLMKRLSKIGEELFDSDLEPTKYLHSLTIDTETAALSESVPKYYRQVKGFDFTRPAYKGSLPEVFRLPIRALPKGLPPTYKGSLVEIFPPPIRAHGGLP